MGNNTKDSEFLATGLSSLTSREQDVFNKLLKGSIPKEIAHSLNISYNTVKTHIKNLYYKLGVNNNRDLIAKYAYQGGGGGTLNNDAQTVSEKSAVFTRWIINLDTLGSVLDVSEKIERIEDQYFPTITITGKLPPINHVFAGTYGIPDPATLDSMRKASRFSFKILGDGNNYVAMIPTSDTRLKSDYNHYRKLFNTKNGEIETISISFDELAQSPFWGNQVPLINENIEFFQIHAYATREFNLKFWDVRFIKD